MQRITWELHAVTSPKIYRIRKSTYIKNIQFKGNNQRYLLAVINKNNEKANKITKILFLGDTIKIGTESFQVKALVT